MKLDIVIPSLNRMEKLNKCVNSIFKATDNLGDDVFRRIHIHLYFSMESEFQYYAELFKPLPNLHIHFVTSYRVPSFWNNHLQNSKADVIMYVNDDVIFYEDTVVRAMKAVNTLTPDFDGLIGIKQDNIPEGDALDSAFGLIGIKYTDRFPNRQMWCPDYHRFYCDREMGEFAKRLGKFHFCPEVKITHLHPAYDKKQKDATHDNVRQYLSTDKETFNKRQSSGLLWGNSWELINKGQ